MSLLQLAMQTLLDKILRQMHKSLRQQQQRLHQILQRPVLPRPLRNRRRLRRLPASAVAVQLAARPGCNEALVTVMLPWMCVLAPERARALALPEHMQEKKGIT